MRRGFIREPQDIKHLILYAMSFLPFAVAEKDLLETVMVDDAFGYFEFAEVFHQLLDDRFVGKVESAGEALYILTPRGQDIISELYSTLPVSVRKRAQQAALDTVARIRRNDSIRATQRENEDGSITLRLAVCDGEREHLAIELPAMSQRQCTAMERNFRGGAEELYAAIIRLLAARE